MKKVLFAINTLGRAGAEKALIEILCRMNPAEYEISLYVCAGQGELISEVPDYVRLINKDFDEDSVLTAEGNKKLKKRVIKYLFRKGSIFKNFFYLCGNMGIIFSPDENKRSRILWKVITDGAEFLEEEYDLAVAFLEGGAAYFVADHVKAKCKAAFVHVDYINAGYSRKLDRGSYSKFQRIFTISDEVKESFLKVYPEFSDKTEVLHNIVDADKIIEKAKSGKGFDDNLTCPHILTVSRLDFQKAPEVSVDACKILADSGEKFVWYVLGDGPAGKKLKKKIRKNKLENIFLTPGMVDNPYPYMKEADIYVHASRYEGKSLAIREAQILGKPILVSDSNGNREQVIPDKDGLMCELTPEDIAAKIKILLRDKDLRERLGRAAAAKNQDNSKDLEKLLNLMK